MHLISHSRAVSKCGPHQLKGITFDLFGTLVDFDPSRLPLMTIDGVRHRSLLAAPLQRLSELAPEVDLAEALLAYSAVFDETCKRFADGDDRELPPDSTFYLWLHRLGIPDGDLAKALAAAVNDATTTAAFSVKGALTLLAGLRRQGYALGLISNFSDPACAGELLSRLGLDACFDAIVISGNVGWRKPSELIFQTAARALRLSPDSLLHVGDEPRADIWGGGHAGMWTAWIGVDYPEAFDDYPPSIQGPTMEAVGAYILAPDWVGKA